MRCRTRRTAAAVFLIFTVTAFAGAQTRPDALQLYRRGDFARAVSVCLQELEEWGPDKVRQRMDSYTVLGWSYLRLGEYEKALNSARQARTEVRYDERLIEIEAESLFYLGRNTDSLALLEEYVNVSPTGDRIDLVYYFMGEIFLRLAEYRHADIAFSTALHHSPQVAAWWSRLGYSRERLENLTGAEAAYETALELQPSLEDARAGLERVRG